MNLDGLSPYRLVLFVCMALVLPASAPGVLPPPAAQQVWLYAPTMEPVINENPGEARPIGLGDVTAAHDLSLKVGLDSFASAVDLYLAIYAPRVLPTFLFFQPARSSALLAPDFVPWRTAVVGPLDEALLGTLRLAAIPSDEYTFFLLAVSAGTAPLSPGSPFYLWATSAKNLRAADVALAAAALFGSDSEAAASIVLGLGSGHSLEEVSDAVLAGTLGLYGEIGPDRASRSARLSGRDFPAFCDKYSNIHECRTDLVSPLEDLGKRVLRAIDRWTLTPELLDAAAEIYTLYLANLGYSGKQIHEAILGSLIGGDTLITFKHDETYPLGAIVKRCADDDDSCSPGSLVYVEPAFGARCATRSGSCGLFGDMDPEDFDLPGETLPSIEGMGETTYYKGTGKILLSKYSEGWSPLSCSLDGVFVAKVKISPAGASWHSYLHVYSAKTLAWTTPSWGTFECKEYEEYHLVVGGDHDDDGTYKEVIETDYTVGENKVLFNKDQLSGSSSTTDYNTTAAGPDVTEWQYDFNLKTSTKEEFKAVVGFY